MLAQLIYLALINNTGRIPNGKPIRMVSHNHTLDPTPVSNAALRGCLRSGADQLNRYVYSE